MIGLIAVYHMMVSNISHIRKHNNPWNRRTGEHFSVELNLQLAHYFLQFHPLSCRYSCFSPNEMKLKMLDDATLGNVLVSLPVALAPGWPLLLRRPQEPPSGRRRTPAWGPEGLGSAVAVSPPQTPNPGSKRNRPHNETQKALHQPHFIKAAVSFILTHHKNKLIEERVSNMSWDRVHVHILFG